MNEKIKLGISSCLLGYKVRWNGGHKLDGFLADELGKYVEYVPVCPEMEVGLGTPRETLRLVGDPKDPRLVFRNSKEDITDRMKRWSGQRLDELEKEELCGYIFKTKSPSSGMVRVKVYDEKGVVRSNNGSGLFARAFMDRFPMLPVEDNGRMHDPGLRENFIVRVFTYHRWRQLIKNSRTVGGLVDFHTGNKLLYMAHHPDTARAMGKLVARAKEMRLEELLISYESMMIKCLKYKSTPSKNANVLYHIMGYFNRNLQSDEKQELIEIIENYRKEYLPLIVPITLLNHFIRKHAQPYLKTQYYLNPHPIELKLRNHP